MFMLNRRNLLHIGSLGAMGLSLPDVLRFRQTAQANTTGARRKSVIYLFLTGGLGQHDSFDMKPNAPDDIRGEFSPIATKTPGLQICEHMPRIAERSHLWSICRSVTHAENAHEQGTYLMLTGKAKLPPTFKRKVVQSIDDPSIVSIAGALTPRQGIMPSAAILPEKISENGSFSGQFAGVLGSQHEPWWIECTDKPHQNHAYSGAFPDYLFSLHKGATSDRTNWRFEVANFALPEDVFTGRFEQRQQLLHVFDQRRKELETQATVGNYDRIAQSAISLMTDPKVRAALDIRKASPELLDRYGNNSFGWSVLMAKRLIEAGVNIVQVNLGNFGSWDLHGNNFPCLKNFLYPPTDKVVAALLDDLEASGQLEDTLVVMAGEFGRTPKIKNENPAVYPFPGRDHWGPCQSVWFAGGGIQGGRVIGASDKIAAYPSADPQTPENFASTIYAALGVPDEAVWHDVTGRSHPVYQDRPIPGLFG